MALLNPPIGASDNIVFSIAMNASRIKSVLEKAAAALVKAEGKLHDLCEAFGVDVAIEKKLTFKGILGDEMWCRSTRAVHFR